jgi:hypothetical protein
VKVQEAAYKLLAAEGRPLSSREIATRLLDQGMVTSSSGDPVFSIASTIEKNIRSRTYNRPELAFIQSTNGRLVGLPAWNLRSMPLAAERRTVAVQIPAELAEKVKLAAQARLAPTYEATVSLLIRSGLVAMAPEIKASLMRQLNALDHAS